MKYFYIVYTYIYIYPLYYSALIKLIIVTKTPPFLTRVLVKGKHHLVVVIQVLLIKHIQNSSHAVTSSSEIAVKQTVMSTQI